MRTFFQAIIFSFCVVALLSCDRDKDEGALPNIAFKTTAGYWFRSDSIPMNDTILVGIVASKAEDKDPLIRFTATSQMDNAAATTIYTENLSGSSGDNYTKDLTIVTRNQVGSEKYTFTVVNKDGLSKTINFTLTVH
jgi:hypothetical protein